MTLCIQVAFVFKWHLYSSGPEKPLIYFIFKWFSCHYKQLPTASNLACETMNVANWLCFLLFKDRSVRIVSHQSPITVREGTNVTLQCEANGSMNIHWKVNSTTLSGSITRSAIEARGIFPGLPQSKNGKTISFLRTLASIENNRTVFTCLGYQNVLSQNIYKSYPVTLLVFGECLV